MIIGVTGLAGSGKDTIAQIIIKNFPSYKKIAFADKLKDITSVLYNWDREMLEGTKENLRIIRESQDKELTNIFNRYISPRNELKLLGVGLKELLQEDIWACIVKHRILQENLKDVVITDVRFPDEIKMIRSLGGIILEVRRGDLPLYYNYACLKNLGFMTKFYDFTHRKERLTYNKIHSSEKSWIGINSPQHIIYNNGTIKDLEKIVKNIMKDLNKTK